MSKKFARRFLKRNADKIAYYKINDINNAIMRTALLAQVELNEKSILFRTFKL